jgi:uncharacterized membrane protein HdeD (DUF308 family)
MLNIEHAPPAQILEGSSAALLIALGVACLAIPIGNPETVRWSFGAIFLFASLAETVLLTKDRAGTRLIGPVSLAAVGVLLLLPISASAFSLFVAVAAALLVRALAEGLFYLRGALRGRILFVSAVRTGAALMGAILCWYAADTAALWEAAFDWPVRTVRLLALCTGTYLALLGALHLIERLPWVRHWQD